MTTIPVGSVSDDEARRIVPLIFDADAMLGWLHTYVCDMSEDWFLPPEMLACALSRVGRNFMPSLLYAVYELIGWFPGYEGLPARAWSSCEHPSAALDRGDWLDLFRLAGYTKNEVPSRRPTHTLTLYRGAVEEYADGMAWTRDLSMARKFAGSGELWGWHRGHVYVARVEPLRLLARIDDRSEAEYVIDTRGLELSVLESCT